MAEPEDATSMVLHVVRGYAGFHLVTAEVLEAAAAAQAKFDATPSYEGFGELRRSGDVVQLEERLETWGLDVESYVAIIARAAGRELEGGDITERLASLDDVDFDGDDDANAPGDHDDVRSAHERENEVVDHFALTVEMGMVECVPADVLDMFDAVYTPTFSEQRLAFVDADRLDDMISVLQQRGFTIVRD